MEAKEVGAGDADDKAVESAWQFHHQLELSRKRKRAGRDALYALYILAGFLTTLVAVFLSYAPEKKEDEFTKLIQWVSLFLAATVSLSAGVLALVSADSKLAKIGTAQAKIVSELFQFRMRTGKYSLSAYEQDNEVEVGAEKKVRGQGTNRSTAMHSARSNFSRQLNDISLDLSSVDLFHDNIALGKEATKWGCLRREGRKAQLEDYVAECLHYTSDCISNALLTGVLAPADYFSIRVHPLLEYIEREEDYLRWMTRVLQISSMCFSSAAVVLSAVGHINPIPAVVAGATGIFQFLKVNDYERRFEIASTAARELGALCSYWQSLSSLDRLRRSSVVKLVQTCEQLALQFETSSIIQVDKSIFDTNQPRNPAAAFGLSHS